MSVEGVNKPWWGITAGDRRTGGAYALSRSRRGRRVRVSDSRRTPLANVYSSERVAAARPKCVLTCAPGITKGQLAFENKKTADRRRRI